MQTKVIAKVTKVFYNNEPEYWQGFVECRHNGRLIWREECGDRLAKEDAKADANQKLDFIKQTSSGVEDAEWITA